MYPGSLRRPYPDRVGRDTALHHVARQAWVSSTPCFAVLTFAFATPVWSVAANGLWPHMLTVLGIAGMAWAAHGRSAGGWWDCSAAWRCGAGCTPRSCGNPRASSWRGGAASRGSPCRWVPSVQPVWRSWRLVPLDYGSWDHHRVYARTDCRVRGDEHLQHRQPIGDVGLSRSRAARLDTGDPPDGRRLWWSRKVQPDWSKALLLGGLVYTVLQATLNRFSGGTTTRYRLTLELLACALPQRSSSPLRHLAPARRMFDPSSPFRRRDCGRRRSRSPLLRSLRGCLDRQQLRGSVPTGPVGDGRTAGVRHPLRGAPVEVPVVPQRPRPPTNDVAEQSEPLLRPTLTSSSASRALRRTNYRAHPVKSACRRPGRASPRSASRRGRRGLMRMWSSMVPRR